VRSEEKPVIQVSDRADLVVTKKVGRRSHEEAVDPLVVSSVPDDSYARGCHNTSDVAEQLEVGRIRKKDQS
jgi:hypothetical protein